MKVIASVLSAAALATVLSLEPDAAAQVASSAAARTTKTADYTSQEVGGDQVVTFTGDELGGALADAGSRFVLRPPGVARAGLIRLRTNFVSELLKSVENL